MAKHVWAVLCRRVIVDGTLNIASLIDTLDEITIESKKPLVVEKWEGLPMEAVMVVLTARSDRATPERSKLKMDLFGPNGELFEGTAADPIEIEIDLRTAFRARTMLNLKKVPFRGSGEHRFVIRLQDEPGVWRDVAELPLDIKITEPPAAQQAIPTQAVQPSVSRADARARATKRRRPKT